jgi:adenylylsulfate kinase
MKILIMGLPGSGKTTLARNLLHKLPNSVWFNSDTIRTQYNDWDFSNEGRLRQCNRMVLLANQSLEKYIICDFIAPTTYIREQFNADFTVFVDTILSSKYENTNQIFEPPTQYNVKVTTQDSSYWSNHIKDLILKT